MESNFLKYYKPKVLISMIVILSISIYFAKENFGVQLAIVSTIILVLKSINDYLWKYKCFTWMYWIGDFSGRYEGFLEYQYNDEKDGERKTGKLKHVKIIKQKGNRICVSSFTLKHDGSKSSESTNIGMFVDKPDDGHYRLIYNYLNNGDGSQGFPPHFGTDVIKVITKDNGEKYLSGNYYTDRCPYQTKGQYIDLKKVSNKLIHEF